MQSEQAFQDLIPNNHCFGCGPSNPLGLQIKSHWRSENESVCHFTPASHHSAGPLHFLNGGIISTLIDCHCVCTAIAKGYQLQRRPIGSGDAVWFATGQLTVTYLKPVPVDHPVELIAEIEDVQENKMSITCQLYSQHVLCCRGEVLAVKVSSQWLNSLKSPRPAG